MSVDIIVLAGLKAIPTLISLGKNPFASISPSLRVHPHSLCEADKSHLTNLLWNGANKNKQNKKCSLISFSLLLTLRFKAFDKKLQWFSTSFAVCVARRGIRELKIYHTVRAWARYWRYRSFFVQSLCLHEGHKQREFEKGIFKWKVEVVRAEARERELA